MRTDVIRWGAISALLFIILYAASWVLNGVSGVDFYAGDDELTQMLQDIDDNDVAVGASAVVGMASTIFLFPVLVGLFFALREEDRPYMVLASIFLGIAALFIILSSMGLILLSGTASDYVDASGTTKDALAQDGSLLNGVYQVFFPSVPMGIGYLITGILMRRSAFFHRYLAWFTIVIGIGSIVFFLWFIFLIGTPIWFLAVAWTMWRKSSGPAAMIAASAPA